MSDTTIKVPTAVRDRLRYVTQRRHTTMGKLLDDISSQLEREERLAEVHAAYEKYQREDPDGFAEDRAESEMWERATIADGLPDAASDFPEFRR